MHPCDTLSPRMRGFSSIALALCLAGCGDRFFVEPSGGSGTGAAENSPRAGTGGANAGSSGAPAAGAAGSGGVQAGSGGGIPGGAGGSPAGAGGDGTGGNAAEQSGLGGPCEGNDDCNGGMHCITATGHELLGGGAPRGYCTQACDADPTVCGSLDPKGVCGPFDTAPVPRWCLLGCDAGASPFSFSDDICRGRRDVACSPLGAGTGELVTACRPFCGSDADCPDGRYCHIALGACVDEKPTGKPVGAKCSAQQVPDPCAGLCLENFCAGYCVMGTEGQAGACGSPMSGAQSGACLYNLDTVNGFSSAGFGDMAVCAPLCDCTAQCAFEDEYCMPLGGDLPQATGRGGYCTPAQRPGELTVCD
jgi:hypothetical protein